MVSTPSNDHTHAQNDLEGEISQLACDFLSGGVLCGARGADVRRDAGAAAGGGGTPSAARDACETVTSLVATCTRKGKTAMHIATVAAHTFALPGTAVRQFSDVSGRDSVRSNMFSPFLFVFVCVYLDRRRANLRVDRSLPSCSNASPSIDPNKSSTNASPSGSSTETCTHGIAGPMNS